MVLFSCLFHLSLLSPSLLSLSVLFLCLRVLLWLCVVGVVSCVLCVVCCCVVWCGVVWCVCCVVCCDTIKTSPCMPAPRAHVETHVRVVPAYTETFWTDTGCIGEGRGLSSASCFSSEKLVIFKHVEQHLNPMSGSCLIAHFLLAKIGPRCYHLLERLTKVTTGSFPFSSLKIGREQTCSRFLQ